jgi:hypothetical protein
MKITQKNQKIPFWGENHSQFLSVEHPHLNKSFKELTPLSAFRIVVGQPLLLTKTASTSTQPSLLEQVCICPSHWTAL